LPLSRDSAGRIAVERRYFGAESPLKGDSLTARRADFTLLVGFVSLRRLCRLVLTSVEYRFDGGIIKLPGDAKASPDSPLSSYLNGWSYCCCCLLACLLAGTLLLLLLKNSKRIGRLLALGRELPKNGFDHHLVRVLFSLGPAYKQKTSVLLPGNAQARETPRMRARDGKRRSSRIVFRNSEILKRLDKVSSY